MSIVYAIIIFCLLVFVHEAGHFISAKSLGVKVNEFALGMGPAIFKKTKGETQYSLRIFPIGGYCAMEGEGEDSDDLRAFGKKPAWAKTIVLVAGSFMNLLLTIVLLAGISFYYGGPTTTIAEFTNISPAQSAGMIAGDKIVEIDDIKIKEWEDIATTISAQQDGEIDVTVKRDGETLDFNIVLETDPDGRLIAGIIPENGRNLFESLGNGMEATWEMGGMMMDIIGQLFTGQLSTSELTGPIGITVAVGDTIEYGFAYVVNLAALISLNLAIMNMLPLPSLDGGRVLILFVREIVKATTGKIISEEAEGKIHLVGIMLLFALMIYITWQDIVRFIL